MGERSDEMKSDRIKRSIDLQRGDLGRDIQELERRVKTTMDWRAQFQKSPMTMIGIAFGGGVLLSTLIGRAQHSRPARRRSRNEDWGRADYGDVSEHEHDSPGASYQKQKALDTWDNIKAALIGVAASKFRTFLGQAVPGFEEQYHKTEKEKPGSGTATVDMSAEASAARL
jgi:hypothetical protein